MDEDPSIIWSAEAVLEDITGGRLFTGNIMVHVRVYVCACACTSLVVAVE